MLERPISKAGWTRVAFGDVVRLSKARVADPEAAGIERVVGLEHIEPGELRIRRWGDVADGTTFTTLFKPGQVLFGKRRAYQRKVAVADFEGVCSGDIYVLEPANDRLMPELLPFLCQTDAFFDHAVGTSAGSLSPRTNWTSLASFEFLLPPIQEQARLVEALSAISDVKRALNEVIQKARVAHSSLVDDVLGLKLSRGRIEYTRTSETRLVRIDDLLDPDRPLSYGILVPGPFVQGGVPMLRVVDFDDFGRRSTAEIQYVSKAIADTSKSTYLRSDDLLLSVVGTIGRTFLVPPEMEGWNVNRALAVLSQGNVVSNKFLEAFFASASMNEYLGHSKVGSAQPRINLEFLREILVPLPSKSRIEAVISSQARMREAVDGAVKRMGSIQEFSSAVWLAIEQ